MLPLLGNFRSRPAVLAAVNAVGGALLDGFAELTAGRVPDDGPGAVELLLTLDEGRARDARSWTAEEIDLDPAPSASPPRVIAEARFLAERLRELVDSGDAERGEIVVLLRAFTHVDAYEEALARAGLRPVRRRRARLLDPAAGRGPDPAARRRLQPARRRAPVRRPRLVRRTGSAPTRSGSCARRRAARAAARATSGRCSSGASATGAEPDHAEAEWLERIDAEDAARLERFCAILAAAARARRRC